MAMASGASHGLAAFAAILLGSLLNIYLEAHAGLLRAGTEWVGGVLVGGLGIPVADEVAGLAVIAAGLSFLWGVGYHKARH